MINRVIAAAIDQRQLVLLLSLLLVGLGMYAVKTTPVDAIPDLSDLQVIVKTRYPGQSPQVVEDQVTYPITNALLAVPGAHTVRGFSFFGDSYVYVIFDDDTDLYWARSRVLEYLGQVNLPRGAEAGLGPDATGVGWVLVYALQDLSGQMSLAELRSLQDWFLKYELQTVPGVSEIAAVGGMVRQYQVEVDPLKLQSYRVPLAMVSKAISNSNLELSASVVEQAEAEYMVRVLGNIKQLQDLEAVPLGVRYQGTGLRLSDVAEIKMVPAMRRGIAELNGEGETVGGVVVMRAGENAADVIAGVKAKMAAIQGSLPPGVKLQIVYDRSQLIHRAVANLWQKVAEELLLVALICAVFLMHIRSAFVAVISLPLGILLAFLLMRMQGVTANIMSLGGIAIAIGAMVDGAVVMVENLHKHLAKADKTLSTAERWALVKQSSQEVGPGLFFSLLIITVSFVPVFTLEAQEGRLFAPLAFTKTYAMAAAAMLTVTLVPVLMGYVIRGKIPDEQRSVLSRIMQSIYRPCLGLALRFPKITLAVAVMLLASAYWPMQDLETEFMPDLDEGDLMYMPTTYPGVSVGEARQILQQTDKIIRTVPEVASVFGKVGRADTATDPAPLTMIETFIQLKPREQWRNGITTMDIKDELMAKLKMPGLSNSVVMPIKTRIDMLATGIKTPLGLKINGPDLKQIEALGAQVEALLTELPGTTSVYSERVVGARYLNIEPDRYALLKYDLSMADAQMMIATAIGGRSLGEAYEGRERYPINLRYPQVYRDSAEKLASLPLLHNGQKFTLSDIAKVELVSGPPMIKSENGRLSGWTFIDIADVSMDTYVANANQAIANNIKLPPGYSLNWAGQYEYLERAKQRLSYIVPLTLGLIVVLLFLSFGRLAEVAMIMLSLPFALLGGLWLLYLMEFKLSIAVGVGFIGLAGIAVETAVIMLVYLNQSATESQQIDSDQILISAAARLRPVMMTATATIAGLLPILWASGTGSEVMQRLAAPMVGGMITTVIMTLIILPVVFTTLRSRDRA